MTAKKKVSNAGSNYLRKTRILEKLRENLNKIANIRACPWCDTRPEVVATHPGTDWVECPQCGAQGPRAPRRVAWRKAPEAAIERWNSGQFPI